MSRELVYKALIAPIVIDAVVAAAAIVAIIELVQVPPVKAFASLAIAASTLAYALLLVRKSRRLNRAAAAVSSLCKGELSYSYTRDTVVCAERLGSSIKEVCYSAQEDRVYCAAVEDPSPAEDTKDFYCVRFDGGEFEDRDALSIYRGRLRVLAKGGVQAGQGTVVIAGLRRADLAVIREACSALTSNSRQLAK